MGDSNGVGPEILAKALADPAVRGSFRPLVIGSAAVYEAARTRVAPGALAAQAVSDVAEADFEAATVPVFGGGFEAPDWRPGELSAQAGKCAAEWVILAARMAQAGTVDGMVTCPLNKEGMHLAGYKYPGHTELIAEVTGAADSRLALFSDTMRIVHNATHCSMRESIELAQIDRIKTTIRLGHEALLRLDLPRRHLAVCGLNPHAGEARAFGDEDADAIAPAIAACREEGIDCSGPYPGDTVFNRMVNGDFDMVVAMFHDQGHIPMKLISMDDGVNVALGVPIVRTSVDHGTAYDIAGTGQARELSLMAAIRLAIAFTTKQAAAS
jgi:4-hydroxythreonine-4-phosphate dehydrogenase